jgi:glutathione S-transferase
MSPEQTETYQRICPTGKIPALTLPDGSTLFESAAICIHLADLDGKVRLAPARGTADHARFLQWMLFLATNVYGSILRYYYAPRYTLGNDAEGVKEAALRDFESHLSLLNSHVGEYVLGTSFSAADLYLCMLASWHPDGDEVIRQKFPKLADLCDNVAARPAVQRVMEMNL